MLWVKWIWTLVSHFERVLYSYLAMLVNFDPKSWVSNWNLAMLVYTAPGNTTVCVETTNNIHPVIRNEKREGNKQKDTSYFRKICGALECSQGTQLWLLRWSSQQLPFLSISPHHHSFNIQEDGLYRNSRVPLGVYILFNLASYI